MISVHQKYIIDDNGKKTNVILTKKDYDRLMDYIEDLEDIAAYDKAKQQHDTPASWKDIKR
ncbi:MAG: hypothetical protein CVV44_09930 [Spirochaetae bacterium HGW-Spirochaetae-1]|jgi:PHD/YefM family antitoxin component YafN of YafNO toxin-antitoxin module|nr:MAG: hypothetical protein CVV44_09930 [Spirochaetae bacterium HGW-Spirochaetae-1]